MKTGVLRARLLATRGARPGAADAGQVTPFVTVLIVALLAVAGLVLDAGHALSDKVDLLDVVSSAARDTPGWSR